MHKTLFPIPWMKKNEEDSLIILKDILYSWRMSLNKFQITEEINKWLSIWLKWSILTLLVDQIRVHGLFWLFSTQKFDDKPLETVLLSFSSGVLNYKEIVTSNFKVIMIFKRSSLGWYSGVWWMISVTRAMGVLWVTLWNTDWQSEFWGLTKLTTFDAVVLLGWIYLNEVLNI